MGNIIGLQRTWKTTYNVGYQSSWWVGNVSVIDYEEMYLLNLIHQSEEILVFID